MSIIPEITEAEAALTSLDKAIQRKINSVEMRQEYQTLLNQALNALNSMRVFAETSDYLRNFGSSSEGER